jgi:uncharacterized protein YaiL (DUF2058 family)
MRYSEIKLVESRGVTARDTGEIYVSDTDPDKTLAVQQIYVVKPSETSGGGISPAIIQKWKLEFADNPNQQAARKIIDTSTPDQIRSIKGAGIPVLSNLAASEYNKRNLDNAFDTLDDLKDAIDQNIPAGAKRVEDNQPTSGSKAAVIAHMVDQDGDDEWHIRYIKSVPATGVHNLWKTINGYKYAKAAKQESVPIKPSDLILDAQPRTMEKLISDLKTNLERTLAGTEHAELTEVMNKAIDLAAEGKVEPIENGANYLNVIAKYGGEYLGVIAIAAGGMRKGDIDKMLDSMNMDTLVGSSVIFPQDKAEELIDSVLITPNGTRLGISTKMHKGGGAASSLSGVVKQLNADIERKFPKGSKLIKLLGTASAFAKDPSKAGQIGIVQAAKEYGIINDEDIVALTNLDPGTKDIEAIKSENLYNMTKSQGVDPKTLGSEDYRVYFHALAAIANDLLIAVNKDQQFADTMMAALNNNNFLQMLTDVRKRGDAITCDYYGKFPAVFEGKPVLYNKVYYATGQKGRIGFKLK